MLKYCYLFHLPRERSTSYLDPAIVYITQSREDGRLTCLLERFNLYLISVFGVISCAARERVHDFRVVM